LDDPKLKEQTLYDLQFIPSSVFYLAFSKTEELNDPNRTAPLRPDLLASAMDLPQPSVEYTPPPPPEENSKGKNVLGSGSSSGSSKVPKWLKVGSKK